MKQIKHLYRWVKCIVTLLLFISHEPMVWAQTTGDDLSTKNFLQYQIWSLGRNYLFGTTINQDRINALAWQLIYTDTLPTAYPGKEQLLSAYKLGLDKDEIAEARQLSQHYKKKYNLGFRLNNAQLASIVFQTNYSANGEDDIVDVSDFNRMLKQLTNKKHHKLANELLQRMRELIADNAYPIVYGRVEVSGAEPADMVTSTLTLLPGGFFVSQAKNKTLSFALRGYKTSQVRVSTTEKIQSLGIIHLKAISEKDKTGFVGSVRPWRGIEKGNIIVRRVGGKQLDLDNPWYQPAIPITILNSGKFYATGLTPGQYEAIIQLKNIKVSKRFTIKKGHIKGLALIDLNKAKPHRAV